MQLSWKVRVSLLAALAAVGCKSGGGGGGATVRESLVNYAGFNLVVVTDTSQSMNSNDRDGFNREGAQLAVSLANVTDNLAVVPFNDSVGEVLPLQAMSTPARRNAFSQHIDGLENARATDYLRAMNAADEILADPGLSDRAAIIFLSDGEHDPGLFKRGKLDQEKARIRELASEFGTQEHRIYTIAFTDEIVSSLMTDMALNSGGAYYKVEAASDLLDAYLEILGDVYELFEYTKDAKEIDVEPIIRRLVYVLIKARPEVGLDGFLTRDGDVVDLDQSLYRRPPSRDAAFDVVQFGGRVEGNWRCGVRPGEGRVVALCQVPISFRIVPGSPAAEYQVNEEMVFQVEAICQDDELATQALDLVEVTAQCTAELGQGPEMELVGRREGARKIVFTGRSNAVFLGGDNGVPEEQDVAFRIQLGDGKWTHTKHAATRVRGGDLPPPPPAPVEALRFDWEGKGKDSVLHLGDFWLGEVDFERTMTVENTSSGRVRLEFTTSALVGPPQPVELAAGASTEVRLAFRGSQPPPGPRASQLRVKATALAGDAELVDQVVDLDLSVYDLRIDMPRSTTVPPGGETTLDVRASVKPIDTPMAMTHEETQTPSGLRVSGWPSGRMPDAGFELTASADAVTAGGGYRATFALKPEGTDLAPKEFSVAIDVGGSKPELAISPTSLSLELDLTDWTGGGEDEWHDFDEAVQVTLTHHAALRLLGDLENLRTSDGAKEIRQYDLEAVGTGGEIQPGQPQRVQIRVNLTDYLTAGTYTGNLTLGVRTPDGELVSEQVPVTVEVRR